MVSVFIDGKQLGKLVSSCKAIATGVPKAIAPAINRALDKGRTTVRREIRKRYLIKSKDIPVRVKGANASNLSGAIIIRQGMLELNKFKFLPKSPTTWRRKGGVYAQVKVGGGGNMAGAFIPAGVGYIGPFIRASGAARLPIHKLLTIGASIMASQPGVGDEINKQMGETYAKRMDHEMKRVLASAGGR